MPGHISDFAENFLYCTYIGTDQHVELLAPEKHFSSQNGGSKFGAKLKKNEVSVIQSIFSAFSAPHGGRHLR
jgi:hypothetical protein